ncbi:MULTISPECIES: protein phosphatase 2C domain-containing protein [unclassified Microbacterium]|uniref:PP2C family protein-serine/threonine phosphatase n=1 Tax=unclassified Microbacterium TaxID=2609290 RepID=UPI000D5173F1|nr:protein phosphatase 2C domain-containing protein [Microbacterium sp. TPD7012]PVE95970.1 serine/threonine-protein phosphatase [Microbacterium sp. TPD7012]
MAETTKTRSITIAQRPLLLSWAGVTDLGRRRETNQDAFLAEYPLFIVADGMGGHAGGEIASRSTVARLEAVVESGEVDRAAIENALELAVADIADHPETTDEGTGTTLTGVFLDVAGDEPQWVSLNIGDSRVYLLRDDRLVQVTTDHSVVQELITAGKLSPEEAEGHPYSNVITRAVGASELTPPDYLTIDVRAGDRFVICSDGLTKELTDYGIQHFLRENADPADAVDAMLAAALENGGRDNVTLVIVQVSGEDDSLSTEDESAE